MMSFRRQNRGLAFRPIQRVKHVVDVQGGVAVGATVTTVLVDTVDNPVLANTTHVASGSTVKSLMITVEVNATTSAALSNAYAYIGKNPGNNLTLPVANVVGGNDNKKFVFHQSMVMLQQQDGSNPRTLMKYPVKIPRLYQRNGFEDRIVLVITSPGVALNFCIQAIYQEFR